MCSHMCLQKYADDGVYVEGCIESETSCKPDNMCGVLSDVFREEQSVTWFIFDSSCCGFQEVFFLSLLSNGVKMLFYRLKTNPGVW